MKRSKFNMTRSYRFMTIKLCLLILVTSIFFTQCKTPVPLPKGDADNGGLFLPDNFEALVVADSTGPARHLAVMNAHAVG